jgi:hypothetical protein
MVFNAHTAASTTSTISAAEAARSSITSTTSLGPAAASAYLQSCGSQFAHTASCCSFSCMHATVEGTWQIAVKPPTPKRRQRDRVERQSPNRWGMSTFEGESIGAPELEKVARSLSQRSGGAEVSDIDEILQRALCVPAVFGVHNCLQMVRCRSVVHAQPPRDDARSQPSHSRGARARSGRVPEQTSVENEQI